MNNKKLSPRPSTLELQKLQTKDETGQRAQLSNRALASVSEGPGVTLRTQDPTTSQCKQALQLWENFRYRACLDYRECKANLSEILLQNKTRTDCSGVQ